MTQPQMAQPQIVHQTQDFRQPEMAPQYYQHHSGMPEPFVPLWNLPCAHQGAEEDRFARTRRESMPSTVTYRYERTHRLKHQDFGLIPETFLTKDESAKLFQRFQNSLSNGFESPTDRAIAALDELGPRLTAKALDYAASYNVIMALVEEFRGEKSALQVNLHPMKFQKIV